MAKWRLALVSACVLACSGPVAGSRSSSASAADELRGAIDAEIRQVWSREKIALPAPADDSTFLRRVSLDLTGIIPTADEAKAFLDDADPHKRAKLIDRLLASPRYAIHQADVWDLVFFGRNPPGEDSNKREGFDRWLQQAFEQNLPYDALARAMLKAEGNSAEQGAPLYLLQYDRHPEDAAVAVSATFLGVQLQCARCHDHPYEPWKQNDFYGLAAFFARLVRVKAGQADKLDKVFVAEMNTGEVKFTGKASEAKAGKEGVPVKPKFLAGAVLEEPDLAAEFKDEKRPKEGEPPRPPKFSRKDKLAEWITTDNRLFARAAVNRVWSQYLGRGLVHPVDNMSESNPPSHPALLDRLASEFVSHHYDLKWLIRELVSSDTYQLTMAGATTEAQPRWFQRARVRPLSAEELLESWRRAAGYDAWAAASGKKIEGGRFHGVTWDYVRNFFGEPNNGVGDFQGGLQEQLYLDNGELNRLMVQDKGSFLESLTKADEPLDARIERLFLATLSRRPSTEERSRFAEQLTVKDPQKLPEAVREAVWTLLTCSEFRFNH
ncbi:MAG TPA: DUF1549 and DUF1553 domain-containing protein [Pirellulales bacterium]|nr:DUF1549 and DUF1553 domain-containing protein [Pirellulales bacterium]